MSSTPDIFKSWKKKRGINWFIDFGLLVIFVKKYIKCESMLTCQSDLWGNSVVDRDPSFSPSEPDVRSIPAGDGYRLSDLLKMTCWVFVVSFCSNKINHQVTAATWLTSWKKEGRGSWSCFSLVQMIVNQILSVPTGRRICGIKGLLESLFEE